MADYAKKHARLRKNKNKNRFLLKNNTDEGTKPKPLSALPLLPVCEAPSRRGRHSYRDKALHIVGAHPCGRWFLPL
jgi:hypothetical protein